MALARAAVRAGVRHLVFISVVGADRVPVRSAIDRAMFGYLSARGMRRPIVPIPLPGAAAAAIRAGANLARDRAVGTRTWEAFLAARVAD